MSAVATNWLPDSGYTPAAIGMAFGDLFQSWSARWFEGRVSVATVITSSTGQHLPQVTQIDVSGSTCTATALGCVKRVLLEKLLGLSLQGCSLNETDHRVLDALGREAMNDLVARTDSWIEKRRDLGDHQITVGLCADGAEILQLHLPRGVLAAAIKSATEPLMASPADLTRRNAVLADTGVMVDAVLGMGKISFGELSELAIGDVLLLDRATDSAADLRLVASGALLAAGQLSHNDDHVVLTLN